MKKIRLFILLIIMMIPTSVFAASASMSVPWSGENGSNVTANVTLYNTAAWNIRITGSGATSNCSASYADVTGDGTNTTKYFSLTCRANSTGVITFSVTGDITSEDGTNSNVSITKTTDIVPPREKETDSNLSSLSVEGFDIGFNNSKKTYSIEVEPSVASITINASAKSRYASINGTGTFEMDGADKVYTITCRAENGTTTDYTINVSIVDPNPILVTIKDVTYKVVKSNKMLTAPTNTTETTINIDGIEVPGFTSESANITIVGLKAEDGTICYAIYDEGKYTLYNENKSHALLLFISEKELEGYDKETITINEKEYEAYKLNKRFYLVYAMNLDTGKYGYYRYDTEDKNFQYYDVTEQKVVKEEKKTNNKLIILILIIAISVILIIFIAIKVFSPKKEKKKKRKKRREKTVDDI